MNYRVSEFRYGEFRLRTILLYYLIWILSMTFASRAVFFRQKCRVGKEKAAELSAATGCRKRTLSNISILCH